MVATALLVRGRVQFFALAAMKRDDRRRADSWNKSQRQLQQKNERKHKSTRDVGGGANQANPMHAAKEAEEEKFDFPIVEFKDIFIGKVIGQGSMGTVHTGYLKSRGPDMPVAIKCVHKQLAVKTEFFERFKKEMVIMAKLHHPNILGMIAACVEGEKPCLVVELMERGDLLDYLRSGEAITWVKILKLATDIARGMQYLHQKLKVGVRG
jgi:hypothetical protein